ncbi:MAG: ATP-binding protein [Nitrosomonadales bacterium]
MAEKFQFIEPTELAAFRQWHSEEENLWRLHDQVICSLDSVKPLDGRRGWSLEQLATYNRERFEDFDLGLLGSGHHRRGTPYGRQHEQVARYKLGAALAEAAPYLLLLSVGKQIDLLRNDASATNTHIANEENHGNQVPFSSISKRLNRIVRQTGKELGKKVNLELNGTDIKLNRGLLEKITPPFEHLLRNAIAHGLESPQQRESSGKLAVGDIRLSLRRENIEVVFEFMDDGAGLDVDALRRKAEEMKLLRSDTEASDLQIMQLIFAPGLSTASEVTPISGRGVGMDVVRSEIAAVGGRITVLSKRGEGTCFIIRLPLGQTNNGV